MLKKEKKKYESALENLKREFDRYYFVLEHGANDPLWADGVNLDLIRNHIIYYKKMIIELCDKYKISVPEIVNRLTPKKVPYTYMAVDSKSAMRSADKVVRKQTQNDGQIKLIF